jgi:hypothetical protein
MYTEYGVIYLSLGNDEERAGEELWRVGRGDVYLEGFGETVPISWLGLP